MANHAFVVPNVMPTRDQITACLQEFVARRFPQFRVETWENDQGPGWYVIAGAEADQVLVMCWLDQTTDIEKIERGRELTDAEWEALPEVPCVEFRHGHAYQFLWWVEDELHTAILTAFPGREWDEGTMDVSGPLPMHEPVPTYFDYLKRRWLDHEKAVAMQVELGRMVQRSAEEWQTRHRVDLHFERECHAGLPAEVIPLLGFPEPAEKLEISYEHRADGTMRQIVKVIA